MKSTEFTHKQQSDSAFYIKWGIRLVIVAALAAIALAVPLLNISDMNFSAEQANWASPSSTTFRRIASKIDASSTDQPSYLSNLNCVDYTFRYTNNNAMQNGCFSQAAYGSMDIDSKAVIFNGTDEAIRVEPSGNGFLMPLPRSAVVASLTPAAIAGSYLNFYTYFPRVLTDVHDLPLLPVLYKQVTGQANLHFTDQAGQQLAVNAESIAFSNNGAWMVVESPWHSFMRVNLANFDILPFASSFNVNVNDSQMHSSQVSISDDGRYVAVQSDEFATFKTYDLGICGGVITSDLKPISCASHDYQQYIKGEVPGYSHITKIRFVNDSTMSINAAYTEGSGVNAISSLDTYLLSPNGQTTALVNYLAVGDSYTSGEGAFNYELGTDVPYNKCHLSARSYPLLLSQDIFHGDGHSVACSGARLHDIGDTSGGYPGQVTGGIARNKRTSDSVSAILNEYSPGYIAQYEFAKYYQPKTMTVAVGGNDMGFANILKTCANISIKASTCYDSYEARQEVTTTIGNQLKPLINLYKTLKDDSPGSAIYVIGYPQILSNGGSCALNVHMDAKEIEFAQEATDYINSIVKQAASAAGVQYVDISQALHGHRLCEARSNDVAVNGLTAGSDDGPWGTRIFGSESYHPTALGQELIEQSILSQTKNFTLNIVPPDKSKTVAIPPANSASILSAPKTGRTIQTVIAGRGISDPVVTRGKKTTVKISVADSGFQPNITGTIAIGGVVVGSFKTDDDGNIQQEVTIPPSLQPGNQTTVVTGQGPNGQPAVVTEPIYVGSSGNDADGDGIPDASDSCPGITNSGIDSDIDGIDDACDGYIGLSPVQTGPSGTNGGLDNTTITPGDSNTKGEVTQTTTPNNGTSTTPTAPSGEPTQTPIDQGTAVIPDNQANAVSTVDNTGTFATVTVFKKSDAGSNSSAVNVSNVSHAAIAIFKQPSKSNDSVKIGTSTGRHVSTTKILPLQPDMPRPPLASIGSIIRIPFNFDHLSTWWWEIIITMCLLLFGVLLRNRQNRSRAISNIASKGDRAAKTIDVFPVRGGRVITQPDKKITQPLS